MCGRFTLTADQDSFEDRFSFTGFDLGWVPSFNIAPTQEVLSPEQREAVENFRRELIETRVSLREVQANLRRDVEALGGALAFFNIAAVPMIVTVAVTGLAVLRRRRRMKARGF